MSYDQIFFFEVFNSIIFVYRMILKDLETVDKQLKKEPDEQSAASVVIQSPEEQGL